MTGSATSGALAARQPAPACRRANMRGSCGLRPIHLSNSPTLANAPRARRKPRAGAASLCFPFPRTRGERSAETARRCLRGTSRAHHDAVCPGRLRGAPRPSCDRGTRASRRSTVAFSGSGPRFLLPECSSGAVQRAPRGQVSVPGGRGPRSHPNGGYEPPAADATPSPTFGTSPETPLMGQDAGYIARVLLQSRFSAQKYLSRL
jgi:hypothetical protein